MCHPPWSLHSSRPHYEMEAPWLLLVEPTTLHHTPTLGNLTSLSSLEPDKPVLCVSESKSLKERSAPYLSHRLGKALSSRAQSPPFLPERENGQNPFTLSCPASPDPLRSSSLHQEIFLSAGQVVTSSLKLVGITAPILQTNKLRPREVQRLAKNHTASQPPILLNVSIDLAREGRKWGHKWAKLWLMYLRSFKLKAMAQFITQRNLDYYLIYDRHCLKS